MSTSRSFISGKRVFVIDENFEFRNNVGYSLQQRNCDVYVFPDIQTAIKAALDAPDIVMVYERSNFKPEALESSFKDAIIVELAGFKRSDTGNQINNTMLIYAAVIVLLAFLLFKYYSNF